MATSKKDSVIFYQSQIDICRRHLTAEQFGRLMFALFEVDEGRDPEVGDDIVVPFEFMALQKRIDQKKYEELCKRNRENGKKGGRPRKNPQKANGFLENPNDNDNENDNDNLNDNDSAGFFGLFGNVDLTSEEHAALKQQYERSNDLIDKVSIWLRSAENPVPDHYSLCVKFANNEKWPKKKVIEPVERIVVEDPLDPEEQEEKILDMKARLNQAISSG